MDRLLAGLAAASSTAQAELLFRPSQLNHLTLNVSDLERSRAFYRKLFGGPQWTVSPALESFDLGAKSYRRILVTERIRRQRLELAI
jgi:hypothetical protein